MTPIEQTTTVLTVQDHILRARAMRAAFIQGVIRKIAGKVIQPVSHLNGAPVAS